MMSLNNTCTYLLTCTQILDFQIGNYEFYPKQNKKIEVTGINTG